MKIGLRTVKTAFGAGIAVWTAQFFGLDFAVTAGVIAILCIEKTKKRSIRASLNRFLTCVIGLVGSGLIFETIGYTALALALFLFLFIPLLVFLKIQEGFVTSVVVILHILTLENINLSIFINELQVIGIGVGVAILFNSVMPNLESKMNAQKEEIERQFKTVLFQFATFLEKGDQGWDGKEFFSMEKQLKEAKLYALQHADNHLREEKKGYYHYFDMREKQFHILYRIMPTLSLLTEDVPERQLFAPFLFQLSENVKPENTAMRYRKELNAIRKKVKSQPLPKSRKEFEVSASLYHLMNEMDEYLRIKIDYYEDKDMRMPFKEKKILFFRQKTV